MLSSVWVGLRVKDKRGGVNGGYHSLTYTSQAMVSFDSDSMWVIVRTIISHV